MTLTSVQAKRTAAKTAVSELTELARGVHTAQQRSDKIEQCKTLLVDQAIDVLDTRRVDTTSKTKDFFDQDIESVCADLGSYHESLGGTFMREMFCNKVVLRNSECTVPPPQPTFPSGPLVLQFPAGEDIHTYLYQFQGTITFQDSSVIEYTERSDLEYMTLPDEGSGYCTLMLRGVLGNRSQHDYHGRSYEKDQIISVWQWGDECVIEDYHEFFVIADSPCFGIDAEDSPKFGVQPNGDVYGTDAGEMISYCTYFNSDISHWDMSAVTDVNHFLNTSTSFDHDLSHWDLSHIKPEWASNFHNGSLLTADKLPDFTGLRIDSLETQPVITDANINTFEFVEVMHQQDFMWVRYFMDAILEDSPGVLSDMGVTYKDHVKWVKAIFNGQEVIFPNRPFFSATISSMYDKGYLYGDGTNGPFSHLATTPIKQDKVVVVDGITYAIGTPRASINDTLLEPHPPHVATECATSELNIIAEMITQHAWDPIYDETAYTPTWMPMATMSPIEPNMVFAQINDGITTRSYSGWSAGGPWLPILRRISQ